MATGNKRNNLWIGAGASFQDRYNLDSNLAEDLSVLILQDEKRSLVHAHYFGNSPIDLSNYRSFEKGSIIFDHQSQSIHMKTGNIGAGEWVSSAAMSS